MRQPDARALALAGGDPPTDPVEEEFTRLLKGESVSGDLSYAREIYEDSYKSEVLEAFLLSGAPVHVIEKTLRVPTKVVDIYKVLFFDRNVFRDEMDVEVYAQTYPEATAAEKWGKELKSCAVTLGLDYLIYRFGRGDAELDMSSALKSMITNAYVLSKATKLNPLDSNAAREARQWMTAGLKGLETYARIKPLTDSTSTEFQIVLETIARTTDEHKSGIKKDDLVH